MGPGDTLNIHAGTYAESILDTQFAGKSGSGSGNNYTSPTTIRAYGTEIVTLTGGIGFNAPAGVATSYVIFQGDSVAKNFVLDGKGIQVGQQGNTGFNHHIKFDGLEIKNTPDANTSGLVQLGESANSDIWFTNIHAHHAVSYCGGGGPGPHGFYVQSPNNIIENTEINNVAGYGIHNYDQNSGSAHNNTYRNLYIHDTGKNQGACVQTTFGITLEVGSGNTAYNNIIANNMNGLEVNSDNNTVYNNTVYGNGVGYGGAPCCYPGIRIRPRTGNFVRNNIVYGNADNSIDDQGLGGATSNNLLTNPLFTNAAGNDFTLQAGSPAINQGTASITIGVTIPACSGGVTTNCYNGAAPDIGALETGVPTVAGGPPTLTPNLTTIAAGQPILLTVDDDDVNERIEQTNDWVGIFAPGALVPPEGAIDNIALFDWFYMNGSKTGPATAISDAVINFTAPLTLGKYEFRFYRNGSNFEADRLATATFTVVAPGIVMKFNVSSLKIGPSVTWKIGTP